MPLILRGDRDHLPWPSGDTPGRLTGLRVGRAGPERPLEGGNLRCLRAQQDPGDVLAKRTVLFPLLQRCRNGCSQLHRRRETAHPERRLGAQESWLGASPGPPQGWASCASGSLGSASPAAGAAGGGHSSVLCLLDPDPPAHLGVRFNALPGLCRGYSGISSAAQARSPGFRATGHINSGDGVGAVLSPGVRQVHRTQPSASPQGIPRPPGSQPEHPAARRPGCFGPAGFPADRLARAVRTRVPAHAHGKLASAPPPTPGHRRHRAGTEPGPGGD